MFSTKFLNKLRSYELAFYEPYFDKDSKILEIGGGTGIQAKCLTEHGYNITSVDVHDSNYASERVFPVIDYDGIKLPFLDKSFDIIFSSNTLEHISNIVDVHVEFKRVLKNEGYCIHVMPTGVWRLWTSVANYVELGQRLTDVLCETFPRSIKIDQLILLPVSCLRKSINLIRCYAIPPCHGTIGNAFTEIYTFCRRHWIKHFIDNGYNVLEARPMGLFYTGHMIFGASWSLNSRRIFSKLLGSATVLYKVEPKG